MGSGGKNHDDPGRARRESHSDPSLTEQEQELRDQVADLQAQVQELQQQVDDTRRRVRNELRRTSTLPVDTFDISDPMVEAALAESAVEIFLRHMTAVCPDMPATDEVNQLPQREEVSQAEIDECLAAIAEMECTETPDPLTGLDDERLWILADLARFGSGLTRQLATRELREFLSEIWNDQVQVDTLKDLVQALRESGRGHGDSALLKVLLLAASNSLARLGHAVPKGAEVRSV